MKLNPFLVTVLAAILFLLGCIVARADDTTTTLAWDANELADKVTEYVVAYRPRPSPTNTPAWIEVVVPAGPAPTTVLPVSPFGTEFRLAAVNKFSRSPWTETVFLPAAARGLKLVLQLTQ